MDSAAHDCDAALIYFEKSIGEVSGRKEFSLIVENKPMKRMHQKF